MNTNLITYDMENFLKKYTRFMTKDIYINNVLYEKFLNQYDYLYQELEKNSILFRENIKYKKKINIKENKKNLLKLHNQKYLKKAILNYQSFFEKIDKEKVLDMNNKALILSDEQNLLLVNNKNNKELISGKIIYLEKYQKIPTEKILILSEVIDDSLKKELEKNGLTKVTYHSVDYYKNILLEDNQIIKEKEKYAILFKIITNDFFPQKEKFKELYNAFSDNIYLNKDYKDFDTFKDYHNYIYKKVYLTSNLSLKKYNEKEIEKRKNYLRTINNITMNNKNEVDVANFLYLNSIPYEYKNKNFVIENNDKVSYISFDKKSDENDNIYLEMKDLFGNNYIEKLIYELIKRRYPLELMPDEEIYNILKNTTEKNYFNEFITNILIPAIDCYDEEKNFSNQNLNHSQLKVLKEVYDYYKLYLKKHNLITKNDFKELVEKEINFYKYIIIIGNIDINTKGKQLKIIYDYEENLIIKENIKLLYDYKKYLFDNSSIPIKHVYASELELKELTKKFKQEKLQEIVKNEEIIKKEIEVYLYDDNQRLLINKNISKLCQEIINQNKKALIAIDNKKQIDNLILKNSFSKYEKNKLIDSNKNIVSYEEISNIKTITSTIIIPFLIKDKYHENIPFNDEEIEKFSTIYHVLSKCRDKLIIICPKSKKQNLKKNLKNIGKYKIL